MRYDEVTRKSSINFIHIAASEFIDQTQNHAEGDWAQSHGHHCYQEITSRSHLFNFFQELARDRVRLDGMDFHNHGITDSDGNHIGISFNSSSLSETLNYDNINHFSEFNSIFNASANITFYGCEVARHFTGEYFLTRVGRNLLSSGGGTVRAYNVLGYANAAGAALGIEEVPTAAPDHPVRDAATLVIARVRANGLISNVHNARYLAPEITRRRVSRLREIVTSLLASYQITPAVRNAISEDLVYINRFLQGLSGRPSYTYMYDVYRWLQEKESRLRYIHNDLSSRPALCLSVPSISNHCGYH